MDGGALLGAPLLLALELLVLYAAGSYAMGRLVGFAGSGGILGRSAFYLLVFPGVVLHESAHYLACLLTGTKVVRFAPFSPQRATDSRLVLGYVRHERRAFPIRAIIGLAPVLLNSLGLLFTTALLTPLTFRQVADPSVGIVVKGIFASGFLTGAPLQAAVWAYLSLSFALGSVPSREDLSGLPLLLAVLGVGILSRIPDGHRRCTFLGGLRPVRAGSRALHPAGRGSRRCLRDGALGKGESVVKHDRARLLQSYCNLAGTRRYTVGGATPPRLSVRLL